MNSKDYFTTKPCKNGKGGWTKDNLLNMCSNLGIKLNSKDKQSKSILCKKISNYFEQISLNTSIQTTRRKSSVKKPMVRRKSSVKEQIARRKSSIKEQTPRRKSSIKLPPRLEIEDCKKNKINVVMKEFKSKQLKTSYGKQVTNPKQAIAIALSMAKRYCE